MSDAGLPETLGFREFAERIGCKPSYVTDLRHAGRLVLTEDRRRVRVAESIALIEDTRDPAKAGVAARHAAGRIAAPPAGTASPANEETSPPASFDDPHARRRAKALADKEEALARKALRDEQIELSQLLPVEEVGRAIAAAVTTFRVSIENLPAVLAPQLAAATDEHRVRVMLADALEQQLAELARKFGTIARSDA